MGWGSICHPHLQYGKCLKLLRIMMISQHTMILTQNMTEQVGDDLPPRLPLCLCPSRWGWRLCLVTHQGRGPGSACAHHWGRILQVLDGIIQSMKWVLEEHFYFTSLFSPWASFMFLQNLYLLPRCFFLLSKMNILQIIFTIIYLGLKIDYSPLNFSLEHFFLLLN